MRFPHNMNQFVLQSPFKPTGDQPQAINQLYKRVCQQKKPYTTLLGVTGSGKTFTLACLISKINQPVLVISHNKTLASQLYSEFKEFFPHNAVEYFVSYYDYYQPESYIPQTDTYIEKDASINERLDRLRLSATSSLASRSDVLIVASVSCIYNLGSPQDYQNMLLWLALGETITLERVLRHLVEMQYERNDYDFRRGRFRLKGDVLDIFPSYKEQALRIEFFGEVIEKIYEFDPLTGKKIIDLEKTAIYPAKHFIVGQDRITGALKTIEAELEERLSFFKAQGKLLEAQRLKQRTLYDIEMMRECGYCHGIENYSRHLSGRPPGSRPYCLLDYFPDNYLTIIDESHVTIPQLRGMYEADRSRKQTLIDYGFRLPSCLDNRPLRYDEFSQLAKQVIFVSATPGSQEIALSDNEVIEQLIRPTGLPDPEIIVKKTKNQIDDLIKAIRERAAKNERTLVTTLTKRMCEELSNHLKDMGLQVAYLHSEIETLERTKLLKDLRMKKFDAIVGVNLLREGLDLPEVSLVAILDADKEGFLRSATSLIQVAGRCARNINGQVFMYADTVTKSMKKAIAESNRRRKLQLSHNKKYHITPASIKKAVHDGIEKYLESEKELTRRLEFDSDIMQLRDIIGQLEKEMYIAAKSLHFEKAAELRDKIADLRRGLKQK